jgi:hypothetical protein
VICGGQGKRHPDGQVLLPAKSLVRSPPSSVMHPCCWTLPLGCSASGKRGPGTLSLLWAPIALACCNLVFFQKGSPASKMLLVHFKAVPAVVLGVNVDSLRVTQPTVTHLLDHLFAWGTYLLWCTPSHVCLWFDHITAGAQLAHVHLPKFSVPSLPSMAQDMTVLFHHWYFKLLLVLAPVYSQ